jgi:hypothetical protein
MTSHRTISLTLTLVAVFATVAPSSVSANSLLSGYGAPGEGNQAILGSALVGGGGGGGGSAGGSSGAAGSPSDIAGIGARADGTNPVSGGPRGGASGARRADGRVARGEAGSGKASAKASGGEARAYPSVSGDDAQPTGGLAGLSFSGQDFGYLLLVIGVLALTGVVTRRLARAPTRPEGL